MVIVVDEYGNTAGLATMEDLLEVIIGEIRDEHEPDSDVIEDGQGGYIVSGNFDLARVSDLLPTFRPEEEIESTTVGGLVSEWLGRVPQAGRVRGPRRRPHRSAGQRRTPRRTGSHQQVANGCHMNKTFQSGFVSIIGRPNAGKSTLLNALVGQKVAIVADKPQTTRTSIQGVLTTPEAQIVFLDTPGIHKADSPLNKRLMDAVREFARRARPAAVRRGCGARLRRARTGTPSTSRARPPTPVFLVLEQDRPGEGEGEAAAAHRAVPAGCSSSPITFPSRRPKGDGLDELRKAIVDAPAGGSRVFPGGPRHRPAGALPGRRTGAREGAAGDAAGGAALG